MLLTQNFILPWTNGLLGEVPIVRCSSYGLFLVLLWACSNSPTDELCWPHTRTSSLCNSLQWENCYGRQASLANGVSTLLCCKPLMLKRCLGLESAQHRLGKGLPSPGYFEGCPCLSLRSALPSLSWFCPYFPFFHIHKGWYLVLKHFPCFL